MKNNNYFYYGQIRTVILHTLRLFSNFCISEGQDENGNEILRKVPCVFMSTDRSAMSLINNNSDAIIAAAPKMVLTISSLDLNDKYRMGTPYDKYETTFTEKVWDEEKEEYIHKPGNSYNVTRLNPLPIGIKFKLYILTSMVTHKLQLFEQIRSMFSPTLELQTSENPLDWTRLTAIVLTGVNWGSTGSNNSSTLDAMDLTFEVNTNIDMPALVQYNQIIETIIDEIGSGKTVPDIMSWSASDITRTFITPTGATIQLQDNNKLLLFPSDRAKTWKDVCSIYGLGYPLADDDVYIHLNIFNTSNNTRNSIVGYITINNDDPTIVNFTINPETLPVTNVDDVDAIIEPHSFTPSSEIGTRYLITDDIYTDTVTWGKLFDEYNEPIDTIEKNCIIVKVENGWKISLNPNERPNAYFLRNKIEYTYLYAYSIEHNIWYDFINRKYRPGSWQISTKTC